jgi:hypothetical protein
MYQNHYQKLGLMLFEEDPYMHVILINVLTI